MAEESWVIEINEKLKNKETHTEIDKWNKCSIYKLAPCVIALHKKAYTPQAVSFGPYHHGEAHLQPMEEHKERALLHFLERSKKPLQLFLDSLAQVLQELKDSYDSLDPLWRENTPSLPTTVEQGQWNTPKFLKMMMLDGCFMLEVLRTADQEMMKDYCSKDPIFSQHGKLNIMPYLKRDMLMLENQLPLLVLHRLLAVETGQPKDDRYVNKLVLDFFYYTNTDNMSSLGNKKCLHILDIYRKSLIPEVPDRKKREQKRPQIQDLTDDTDNSIIRCMTELNEAGIRFKKSETQSLRDISFNNGILRLPSIVIDDSTESTFLNLIAFERFHVGAGNEITSYVFLMDNLIDSERDVALLNSNGIIQNAMGSDKAVAQLFNSLSKDTTLDPESSLENLHRRVNEYCKQPFHQWRANLCHTYFRSPWALISLIAGIILFALAITSTSIDISDYVNNDSVTP